MWIFLIWSRMKKKKKGISGKEKGVILIMVDVTDLGRETRRCCIANRNRSFTLKC